VKNCRSGDPIGSFVFFIYIIAKYSGYLGNYNENNNTYSYHIIFWL